MVKSRKIGVFTSAKLLGRIGTLIGLILGIIYSFGGLFYELATDSLNSGTALAFLALLGMPIIFATIGFLVGAIGALLYNLVAART